MFLSLQCQTSTHNHKCPFLNANRNYKQTPTIRSTFTSSAPHSYLPHSNTCKFSPPQIGGRGGSGIITHATKKFLNNGNWYNYESSFTLAIQGLTCFAEPSSHVNIKQEGFGGLNNDIGDGFDGNINGQGGGNRGAGGGASGSSSSDGGGNGGTGGGDGMEEWEWNWGRTYNILFAIATSLFRSIWDFGGADMRVEFLGAVVTGIIYMMEPIIEEIMQLILPSILIPLIVQAILQAVIMKVLLLAVIMEVLLLFAKIYCLYLIFLICMFYLE